jgi:hypothetical protein
MPEDVDRAHVRFVSHRCPWILSSRLRLAAELRDEPRVSCDPTFSEESSDLAACASPAFADGVARGRTMPLEQAVAEAQAIR